MFNIYIVVWTERIMKIWCLDVYHKQPMIKQFVRNIIVRVADMLQDHTISFLLL